jgi:exopolyphosphatase/guanosine-5'-triphosphate,3'-diphosphate pyrophosphatase
MREARNGREFVHRVRSELGFEIEIISGDDEARLGWAGSLCDLDLPTDAAPYTVDIGGGSTELAWDSGHQRVSLPLGCVRFLEHHITSDPPSPDDLNAMRCDIATNLRKVSPLNTIAPLIAVGGTATTLLAIAKGISPYDPQQIHGHTMSLATLQNVLGQLSAVPLQQRKQIRGLEPERADVIIPGAIILITICEYLNQQSMIVSDRGLRYGLLLTT